MQLHAGSLQPESPGDLPRRKATVRKPPRRDCHPWLQQLYFKLRGTAVQETEKKKINHAKGQRHWWRCAHWLPTSLEKSRTRKNTFRRPSLCACDVSRLQLTPLPIPVGAWKATRSLVEIFLPRKRRDPPKLPSIIPTPPDGILTLYIYGTFRLMFLRYQKGRATLSPYRTARLPWAEHTGNGGRLYTWDLKYRAEERKEARGYPWRGGRAMQF